MGPLASFHLHLRIHLHLQLHRPRVRRQRTHGTIARVEHREPPLAFELVMKLARVLPPLAHSAALVMMVLGGAPVRAADPDKFQIPMTRDEHAGVAFNLNRDTIVNPEGKSLRYNLGMTIAAVSNTSLASAVRGKSSPRITNLSGYTIRSVDFDRQRFFNARGRPSVTVLDQRVVLSRITYLRNRIQVAFSAAF
jgi:hypothetical protein